MTQIGARTQTAVKTSLKIVALSTVLVLAVAAVVAAVARGEAGLQAVALCAVAGAVLFTVTVATHLFTLRHVDLMMAGMGADFILKLLVVIIAVFVAKRMSGLDPYVLFGTMLALILVQTITFPVALTRARIPITEAAESPAVPDASTC